MQIRYEEFVKDYMDSLKESFGKEVELQRLEVTKVNEKLDGLTVKLPESNIAPTIYFGEKYDLFNEGYSMEQLVEETKSHIEKAIKEVPDLSNIKSLEEAKNKFYCCVINTNDNQDLLKGVPHEKLHDLSVVSRFRVNDEASFLVTNSFCSEMKMTSEEVMAFAHSNTDREQFKCENMMYTLKNLLKGEGVSEEYLDEIVEMEAKNCPIYVLTNDSMVNGAAALASSVAMTEAYEKLKNEYPEMEKMTVIASSRHELLLIPDVFAGDKEELINMHRSVQEQEVADRDKLSDNIYQFDGRSLSIIQADSMEITETLTETMFKSHARSH